MKKLLYSGLLVMAFVSLQGCFFWHTTEHDRQPASSSTTVVTP